MYSMYTNSEHKYREYFISIHVLLLLYCNTKKNLKVKKNRKSLSSQFKLLLCQERNICVTITNRVHGYIDE